MARRMIHMPADTDLNHLFVVWTQAERLLFEHGLKDKKWKVVFDNTKMRGGQCRYAQREIGVSAHLFAIWTYEQCIQTVLHEVAHALCPGHLHDKVWKAKAKAIGYTGERCWGTNGEARIVRPKNWIGTCPNGHTHKLARKPGKAYSCGRCSPGNPSLRYLVTWRKTNDQ